MTCMDCPWPHTRCTVCTLTRYYWPRSTAGSWEVYTVPTPWVCPVCFRVYGPQVTECAACNDKVAKREPTE